MACSCRASSLRIFVQSLTRLHITGSNQRSAGLLESKTLGACGTSASLRSFTAATARRHPRQSLRALERDTASSNEPNELSHNTLSHETSTNTGLRDTADLTQSNAADSAVNDQASIHNNAIFDLSPEAIDALAAEVARTSDEPTTYDDVEDKSAYEDHAPPRRKAELSGSSRLKRSKIMPADKKPQHPEGPAKKRELWAIQKEVLKEKFPEGWNPRKKLSPDALDGIRALHTQYPQIYTTDALSSQFQVSPEAMRRILKSKWRPSTEEDEKRQERWFNRGKSIWSQMAELGTKPPKKWREAGVARDPRFNKKRGPRMEYPYVPKWKEKESAQRKLGDNLL